MSDQYAEQRAELRRQQERQYDIDRITFQYAEDYRAGHDPRIEDYMQRYPEYADELLEYALYFHASGFVGEPLVEPDVLALSPADERAMAAIRERSMAYAPASPATSEAPAAIESLIKQGSRVQLGPRQLAAAVGLSPDILAKLEEHAIAAATIPRTLLQRFAEVLKATPEAIAAFLGAAQPGQSGAFYYAEQRPDQPQESFLDAVQTSMLSPDSKREWAETVAKDLPASE